MNFASALLLGFGLGLRHATDSDHVVAVTALVQRDPSPWRAASIALWWGLGHSSTFFAVGLVVIAVGVRVPASFTPLTEALVGGMLVTLGLRSLWRLRGGARRSPPAGRARSLAAPPFLVGSVHGLGGSATVALLATMAVPTSAGALAYLGMFGVGSVLGMVALTVAMSWPLAWLLRRGPRTTDGLFAAVGVLGVVIGGALLIGALPASW